MPDRRTGPGPVTTPLRLEAPAKLNLSLRVIGRREDGLHELDSLFVMLELSDDLLLLPGCSGLRVEGVDAAGLPVGPDNLAWRGLIAGMGGAPELCCLALDKRVPAAAGLGGGSSDAAAAWRLGRAWRSLSDVPNDDDVATLTTIGADVPFFATATPAARVTGVGERVAPIPAIEREVVLVHPRFGLSTAEIFAELRADEWGRQENDLLAPALRLRPELDDLIAAVAAAGGQPKLTGSGSTIFCLEENFERAAALAMHLGTLGLRVTHTRTRATAPAIHRIEEEP
jgi:4-diphosphocytidyl-2-C-methyl-D-erythritol kinase